MPEYSLSTETPVVNQVTTQPGVEATTVQDNMARIALLLDQLTKAVVELRERAAKTESQITEISPCLDAMKVHVNSFPIALREARRANVSVQQRVETLSLRLAEVESCLKNGPVKV